MSDVNLTISLIGTILIPADTKRWIAGLKNLRLGGNGVTVNVSTAYNAGQDIVLSFGDGANGYKDWIAEAGEAQCFGFSLERDELRNFIKTLQLALEAAEAGHERFERREAEKKSRK